MDNRKFGLALLFFFGCFFVFVSAIPMMVPISGEVKAQSISDCNRTLPMQFTIYDSVTGGNAFWRVSNKSIDLNAVDIDLNICVFSSFLGDTAAGDPVLDLNETNGKDFNFVEVKIQGNSAAPRVPIGSTFFSYQAKQADSVTGSVYSRIWSVLDANKLAIDANLSANFHKNNQLVSDSNWMRLNKEYFDGNWFNRMNADLNARKAVMDYGRFIIDSNTAHADNNVNVTITGKINTMLDVNMLDVNVGRNLDVNRDLNVDGRSILIGRVGVGTSTLTHTGITVGEPEAPSIVGAQLGVYANGDAFIIVRNTNLDKEFFLGTYGGVPSVGTFTVGEALSLLSGGGVEVMILASDQNVGIGTATPATKFNVIGDVNGQRIISTLNRLCVNGTCFSIGDMSSTADNNTSATFTGTINTTRDSNFRIIDVNTIVSNDGNILIAPQDGNVGIPQGKRFCWNPPICDCYTWYNPAGDYLEDSC